VSLDFQEIYFPEKEAEQVAMSMKDTNSDLDENKKYLKTIC
jgi:hypothetical protein